MFKKKATSIEKSIRLKWILPDNQLSIRRQCQLSDIPSSTWYYEPIPETQENLNIMELIDKQYLQTPFYGVPRMSAWLKKEHGLNVNHKRVRRLMKCMNLCAIYPKRNLSKAMLGNKIYPYLLRNLPIERVNQVWSTDITYIGMKGGFLYLCAVMDWFSRYVIAWKLSNSMDLSFCTSVLEEALGTGKRPEIFNTDQGSQFTSETFTNILLANNIKISMDGKGRALDNVFIERLWRSIKYEHIFLHRFEDGHQLCNSLHQYFTFYNHERLHQALDYKTPQQIFAS